jgi:hypothetical protein
MKGSLSGVRFGDFYDAALYGKKGGQGESPARMAARAFSYPQAKSSAAQGYAGPPTYGPLRSALPVSQYQGSVDGLRLFGVRLLRTVFGDTKPAGQVCLLEHFASGDVGSFASSWSPTIQKGSPLSRTPLFVSGPRVTRNSLRSQLIHPLAVVAARPIVLAACPMLWLDLASGWTILIVVIHVALGRVFKPRRMVRIAFCRHVTPLSGSRRHFTFAPPRPTILSPHVPLNV